MNHYVITIARQYGSGGRTIGENLARKLGISYYDKKIIHRNCELFYLKFFFHKNVDFLFVKISSSYEFSYYSIFRNRI